MKPLLLPAIVLAASLSVVAGTSASLHSAQHAAQPGLAGANDPACPAGSSTSPALSAEDRAALRSVELRDADLSDVKAGFAMASDDTMLVLGTVLVVVLIVLIL